ncbi:hypothetical protein [Tenacibaculum dicentrarchi]
MPNKFVLSANKNKIMGGDYLFAILAAGVAIVYFYNKYRANKKFKR